MKTALALILISSSLLAACSETPIEEQGKGAQVSAETEIAQEAKSLEKAADEAVEILRKDSDAALIEEQNELPPPSTNDGTTDGEPVAPASDKNEEQARNPAR